MSPISSLPPPGLPGAPRPADDPAEAARQFESVLVRQFVEVMTKDLFQSDEEGMLTGQADLQRDTLTDTLTEHLVDNDTFGIADLLMAQWERAGQVPAAEASAPPAPHRAMTMDEALRLYPPAHEPAASFTPPPSLP